MNAQSIKHLLLTDPRTYNIFGKISFSRYQFGGKTKLFQRSDELKELLKSKRFFSPLKDKYKGERCFIIGNGPSINQQDLTLLKNEFTIGSNFIFLNYEKMGFHPTFLTIVNFLVAEQRKHEINNLKNAVKIFPYFLSYCMEKQANTFFLNSAAVKRFSTDILQFISWQSTVTFFNLQLAYYLGFERVYLIGVDNSYIQPTKGKEGSFIQNDEDDINHFSNDYFKGLKWQKADTDAMELVYLLAKEAYEKDGKEIINAGFKGSLELFRREDYETLFSTRKKNSASLNSKPQITKSHKSKECVVASVNPDLLDQFGHYFHYDEVFKKYLNNKNIELYTFANKRVSEELLKKNRFILPIFTAHSWNSNWISKGIAPRKINKISLQKELVRAIKIIQKVHPMGTIKLLCYCGSFNHFILLQEAIKNIEDVDLHINLFWEHYNVNKYEESKYVNTSTQLKSLIDNRFKELLFSDKYNIYVDTLELNNKINQLFNIELPLWPMFPVTDFSSVNRDVLLHAAQYGETKACQKVFFPGSSRTEKGFPTVLEFVSLMKQHNFEDKFHITIRDANHNDSECESDLNNLRNQSLKNLNIVKGTIPVNEYIKLFTTSDIIGIPYRSHTFRTRTSAVFCDSVVLLKPMVAVKGTWMGNQIMKNGFGELFDDGNALSLLKAIEKISENYSVYTDSLIDKGEEWLLKNNPNNFLDRIVQI